MEESVVILNPCDRGWGAFVILGVISLLFGFLMMLFPETTAIAVLTLVGVLLIILGVIMLLSSLLMPAGAPHSLLLLVGGIVGILAGVGVILYPIVTGSVIVEILGAAIIIIGMMQLLFGLVHENDPRRVIYIVSGIVSILFALLIVFYPWLGGIILFGFLVGVYFMLLGILIIAAGYLSHRICSGMLSRT